MEQQLAHYKIEELIGEGSFAQVYRAFDQKFERDVALKVLKPIWMRDPKAIARFKEEAKTIWPVCIIRTLSRCTMWAKQMAKFTWLSFWLRNRLRLGNFMIFY